MLTETHFQLFKVPCIQKASHLMTDVPFWAQQFALLSDVNHGSKGIQKAVNNIANYLNETEQGGLKGKDEKRFHREVSSINEVLGGQKLTYTVDDLTDSAQRLKGDFSCTDELYNEYRKARDSLDRQMQLVESHRKKYHELAFRVERAEIKVNLADGYKALYKARESLNKLYDMVEAECSKYCHQLEKWKVLFSKTQMLSDHFGKSYLSREAARAEMVLSCLQEMSDRTIAGRYKRRNPVFTSIDERRFLEERVIKKEIIQAQYFQAYCGEIGKQDMYERTRSEVENITNTNNSSQSSKSDYDYRDLEKTFTTNRKLNSLVKVFGVAQGYNKQNVNQLNLKPGDRIRQILPPNENGLAYGER